MNPIVGIGEVLWDVYPDGRKVAGGAPFNFAFHCHQLGHPAVIVSRVGNDDLGRELRDRVRELGLSDEYIQTDREHPTGTVQVTPVGSASHVPVPADYDGDGIFDVAVYHPATRVFSIIRSSTGTVLTIDLSAVSPAGSLPVLRKPQ